MRHVCDQTPIRFSLSTGSATLLTLEYALQVLDPELVSNLERSTRTSIKTGSTHLLLPLRLSASANINKNRHCATASPRHRASHGFSHLFDFFFGRSVHSSSHPTSYPKLPHWIKIKAQFSVLSGNLRFISALRQHRRLINNIYFKFCGFCASCKTFVGCSYVCAPIVVCPAAGFRGSILSVYPREFICLLTQLLSNIIAYHYHISSLIISYLVNCATSRHIISHHIISYHPSAVFFTSHIIHQLCYLTSHIIHQLCSSRHISIYISSINCVPHVTSPSSINCTTPTSRHNPRSIRVKHHIQ